MMSKVDAYALALFEFASEKTNEIKSYRELQNFAKYLEDSEVKEVLNRSLEDYRIFDSFWDSLKGEFSPEVIDILRVVQEDGLISDYDRLVLKYKSLLEKHGLIHFVDISSPNELTDKERDDIVKEIKRHYNGILNVQYTQDPSLVSGLKVRVNNDIFDTSIKHKFEQILSQGGSVHE